MTTTTTTHEQLLTRHQIDVPAHLVGQIDVPINTGAARQGDVLVAPLARRTLTPGAPVGTNGVPVVRGEAGGNTHLLVADGHVTWADETDTMLALGRFTVAESAVAWLLHPQHGAMGFGPGTWRASRKRQQADELARIAD